MKNFIILFILLVFLAPSYASKLPNYERQLDDVPLEKCNLQIVTNELILKNIEKSIPILNNISITMEELNKLVDKLPDTNKPIEFQLNIEDQDKFSKASQRLMAMNLILLVESRKERDINVIRDLAEIADNNYRWGKIPNKSDPMYFYYELLMAMRINNPEPNTTSFQNKKCNLYNAINLLELEPIKKINELLPEIKNNKIKLDEIAIKYNITNFSDISKLNKEDREFVLKSRSNLYYQLKKEMDYINDLENIKQLILSSDRMYSILMDEISQTGGDMEKFLNVFAKKYKSGEINKHEELFFSTWLYINEKIPSRYVKDFEQIKRQIKQ